MRFLSLILTLAVPAWGQQAVTPTPTTAPAGQVLTLNEAVRRALDANLTVQRSRAEVTAADLQRRTIVAAVLPKVNIAGTTTQNSEEVSFGSGSDSRVILPGTDWGYRLTFSQPIYAGFREKRALQQARLATDNARQGVLSAEDQVLTNVVADYLSVLEGESLL